MNEFSCFFRMALVSVVILMTTPTSAFALAPDMAGFGDQQTERLASECGQECMARLNKQQKELEKLNDKGSSWNLLWIFGACYCAYKWLNRK